MDAVADFKAEKNQELTVRVRKALSIGECFRESSFDHSGSARIESNDNRSTVRIDREVDFSSLILAVGATRY